MTTAKMKLVMTCSECEEPISKCRLCDEHYLDTQSIMCYNDGNHVHTTCLKNIKL